MKDEVQIFVKDYKCFGPEVQGFHFFSAINLIVGRNNVGKSALLEVLEIASKSLNPQKNVQSELASAKILIRRKIRAEDIEGAFSKNTSGGFIPGPSHFQYGRKWVGHSITAAVSAEPSKHNQYVCLDEPLDVPGAASNFGTICQNVLSPFQGKQFRRITAERNVVPEGEGAMQPPHADGTGTTNLIQRLVNDSVSTRGLVEEKLLHALNEVLRPDLSLKNVLVQRNFDKTGQTPLGWEIFFEETNGKKVSLSNSGSGIKTVLLALLNLVVIPAWQKKEIQDYVFVFEELENNLHPALQRRLFSFINKIILENEATLFLTSHSSVALDFFSREKDCNIIHLQGEGKAVKIKQVKGYFHKKEVLDDLEVRASDVLLSNSIVWVEGPTDAIIVKKWIELYSGGKLKEGEHFQCLSYGGKLLSGLSAASPEETESRISMLSINGNIVVLMDSDKGDEEAEIGATKLRVAHEVSEAGGVAWVTSGREVENYIPLTALRKAFPENAIGVECGVYENYYDYMKNVGIEGAEAFRKKKVEFFLKVIPFVELGDILANAELTSMLKEVVGKIGKWNGLETVVPV